MRKVLGVYSSPRPHWVGDGFPVRSMFSHASHGEHVSPFLLLDYAGPAKFPPAEKGSDHRRGVGIHPHRGFETVTIVYQGEVEHRDSTGNGGIIGAGDVQWMTAAKGILHEEFHSRAFTQSGGTLQMVQLWVNLPAKNKNAEPGYQSLLKSDIPVVDLADKAGCLRVIAGQFGKIKGPARTFTPINLWDVWLKQNGNTTLNIPEGHTAMLVVLSGTITINNDKQATEAQLVLLNREGDDVRIEAANDASFLVLSGEPINEPVVIHGPFVMNTTQEISAALRDFQSGRFGTIPVS
ncbi:pirin family protein [Pseudochrobactrum kiredjianiae]|uniref:Pirin family protein n=1 Tax=Pseudochrobactrum kiredjianiae TaxID=386305 RepID=A0ABW3V6S8_9HYPH|nr:pirin family protein [Pseudochrobactrum kiredjianiae]MDM7850336.1 pirin family protein [Pseudochrobactrum kiredjianiae]